MVPVLASVCHCARNASKDDGEGAMLFLCECGGQVGRVGKGSIQGWSIAVDERGTVSTSDIMGYGGKVMQSFVRIKVHKMEGNKLRFAWAAFGPQRCESGKFSDQVFEKISGVLARG